MTPASKIMRFYYESIQPIDDWSAWKPLEEYLRRSDPQYDRLQIQRTLQLVVSLIYEARDKVGVYPDLRQGDDSGIYVSGIPVDDLVVAFKLDNNGTTFVSSPHELETVPGVFEPLRGARR